MIEDARRWYCRLWRFVTCRRAFLSKPIQPLPPELFHVPQHSIQIHVIKFVHTGRFLLSSGKTNYTRGGHLITKRDKQTETSVSQSAYTCLKSVKSTFPRCYGVFLRFQQHDLHRFHPLALHSSSSPPSVVLFVLSVVVHCCCFAHDLMRWDVSGHKLTTMQRQSLRLIGAKSPGSKTPGNPGTLQPSTTKNSWPLRAHAKDHRSQRAS